MNDGFLSRFVKGVMSLGIGTLATILLGFLNIIIVIRVIPKEAFGAYVLIQVIVTFLVMIADLGMNTSVIKYVAGSEGHLKEDIADTVFFYKLASATALSLGVYLAGGLILPVFKSSLLIEVMGYIPVLLVLESINGFFNSVLQGHHYYKRLAIGQVLLSMVSFIAMLALVVWLEFGILGLIYARIAAFAVTTLYQAASLGFRVRARYSKDILSEIFRFGFPLGLNSMLNFVFTRLDTLIIGAFLSPVGVASYGAASRVPESGRQMFDSFRSVYFPNMSELLTNKRQHDAERVLSNSLRIVSFLSAFVTLIVVLFQNEIVKLLFSEKYLDCAPVLSMLMVVLCLGAIGNVLGTTLVSAGYSKLPVIINIVDAGVNIAANLILIPIYGIMGAAYAALLARIATNPVNVFFLKKYGVRVSAWVYLKPLAILLFCSVFHHYARLDNILSKLSLLLLFLALCKSFLVITYDDFFSLAKGLRYRPQEASQTGGL